MDTQENNPAPQRGLSDQQAVDMMLTPEDPKEAPQGQAESGTSEEAPAEADPQAIGHETEAPPVDPEEQAVESLVEDEADSDEQVAPDGEEAGPEAFDDEHSEESAEEAETRVVEPTDVIFHDPEGNPVTVREAHQGYLRQADYTRKTQEIAAERDKVQQAFAMRDQERQVLAEHINMALNVIEPTLAEYRNVDWDKLASDDPHTYARTKAMYEQASERYLQLKQVGEQTLQQDEQARARKFQQHLAVQDQIARRLIPELADPKQAPQVKARMKAYLTKAAGFSEQEASRVSDARLLNLVNKALQFDLMQARNNQLRDKKVRKAPKAGMKPGSPKTQAQRQEQARAKQMSKLRSSGKMEDAVDLLLKPT